MPIMNDINKEMIKLEEKYKDFFDGIAMASNIVQAEPGSIVRGFYGIVGTNRSSFASFREDLKQKLPIPIIKEMQAIIDDFNR